MKFEAHAGREFLAKLEESIKEIGNRRFELALGAVERGVDSLLAQEFSEALNQVQIE